MAASKAPFEVFEHTADVGIIARGGSLPQLFENCALGMFSLMAGLSAVEEREQRTIGAEGHDWESLLVNWLSSLLYYLDAEGLLLSRFCMTSLEPYRLKAIVYGEKIEPGRHELHFGVKAVTRHQLEIRREDGSYLARIIFDI